MPIITPTWHTAPERQLEKARQLWRGITLPEPPTEFTPRTESEVLLLHVPASFDKLWGLVVPPRGYAKYRWDAVKSDRANLRLAPKVPNRTTPVWLGFDPEHGRNKRPDSLWGQPNLAASEVFSALIQFPNWPLAWFNGASAPNLSGYKLKLDWGWSGVPCLSRWWGGIRQLGLNALWAGHAGDHRSSPSVRGC